MSDMEMTLANNAIKEDLDLMNGLLHHSPSALEKLYSRYKSILRSIVLQVLHDEAEADDVLQDVFLQVWDRAQSYSAEKGRLVSWLATLARRRAIDRVRQHSAYRRATDRYEAYCMYIQRDGNEDPVGAPAASSRDLKDLLQHYIETLPLNQRQAIRMAFFERKSQREISALTGTPLGTVKTRIELGIKKLAHSIGAMREKIV